MQKRAAEKAQNLYQYLRLTGKWNMTCNS